MRHNIEMEKMKKCIFYYLFAVVCTVCLFTACSDDDDDDPVILSVDQVTGTFTGNFEIESLTANYPGSVTVTKVSDSKIKLELANFMIPGIEIDPISVECNVTLDADRDEFALVGTGTATVSSLGSFPVTVSGDIDTRELDVDITVAQVPVLGGIVVEFDGRK